MHPPDATVGEWACICFECYMFFINANMISVCCSCSPSGAPMNQGTRGQTQQLCAEGGMPYVQNSNAICPFGTEQTIFLYVQ